MAIKKAVKKKPAKAKAKTKLKTKAKIKVKARAKAAPAAHREAQALLAVEGVARQLIKFGQDIQTLAATKKRQRQKCVEACDQALRRCLAACNGLPAPVSDAGLGNFSNNEAMACVISCLYQWMDCAKKC